MNLGAILDKAIPDQELTSNPRQMQQLENLYKRSETDAPAHEISTHRLLHSNETAIKSQGRLNDGYDKIIKSLSGAIEKLQNPQQARRAQIGPKPAVATEAAPAKKPVAVEKVAVAKPVAVEKVAVAKPAVVEKVAVANLAAVKKVAETKPVVAVPEFPATVRVSDMKKAAKMVCCGYDIFGRKVNAQKKLAKKADHKKQIKIRYGTKSYHNLTKQLN